MVEIVYTYYWIRRVFTSCNTLQQLVNSKILIERFERMFGHPTRAYDLIDHYNQCKANLL